MPFSKLSPAGRRFSGVAFVLVAGITAALAAPASADPVSYIYGIDDNNLIWEIDPVGKTATQVFTAQGKLGISGTANSNAFAYDAARENMFFLNGSGTSSTLYVWNKPTSSLSIAATAAQLNIASGTFQPANAAFNAIDGKYYFFEDTTADLYSISFTYSGNIPTFSASSFVTVVGAPTVAPNGNYFGDIAIDADTGILYAATNNGQFYTVDLASPTTSYTPIKTGNPSLQLSFDFGHNTLYGHVFSTKEWYTVNLVDGSVGSSFWTSPVAFRDLGGASSTQAPVPEIDPTAFGGVLALVVGSLGLFERRRLAAAV